MRYDLSPTNIIMSSRCQYNNLKYKNNFSISEVYDMYNNDYIGFNLKNLILSKNVIAKFTPLKELNLRDSHIEWNIESKDPFLEETSDSHIHLGLDIIKNGTYWPIILDQSNSGLYVLEGSHRVVSLKMCQKLGYIDDDFKLFTLYMPYNKDVFDRGLFDFEEINPVEMRFVLEVRYNNEIVVNKDMYIEVCNDVIKNNGKIVNSYTGQIKFSKRGDIVFGRDIYPMFLRDLIYENKNMVKPNIVINDEYEYSKWIEI